MKFLLGENNTKKVRPLGHGIKAYIAAIRFGFPGKKLTLIGVNGTKGKTTTTILIARILNILGIKTGFISGALIFNGAEEFKNPAKLSTIDGWDIQRVVKQMLKNGCKICVIELTSQGLEQRRHVGLGKFHTTVFLNAYPEHLEAHGGWGKYILAKSHLFKNTAKNGYFVGNYDHDQLETTQKLFHSIPYSIRKTVKRILVTRAEYNSLTSPDGLHKDLEYKGKVFPTKLLSDVEVTDLFFAIKTVKNYYPKIEEELAQIVPKLKGVPGRMQWVVKDGKVPETQNLPNFKMKQWKNSVSILVDYAHEPESMKKLFETIQNWRNKKTFTQVIHILSSDGAGRDVWKRQIHGDLSYQYSDYTILTTDNYESKDDPQAIIDELGQNYPVENLNKKYFKIINRLAAFKKALEISKSKVENDSSSKILIVSTGVGTESGLTQPGGIMDWDEVEVWKKVFEEA